MYVYMYAGESTETAYSPRRVANKHARVTVNASMHAASPEGTHETLHTNPEVTITLTQANPYNLLATYSIHAKRTPSLHLWAHPLPATCSSRHHAPTPVTLVHSLRARHRSTRPTNIKQEIPHAVLRLQ